MSALDSRRLAPLAGSQSAQLPARSTTFCARQSSSLRRPCSFVWRSSLLWSCGLLWAWSFACLGCSSGSAAPESPLGWQARQKQAEQSSDADQVGHWLLRELFSPGGSSKGAERARRRLDALERHGPYAHLARGLDDQLHGRLQTARVHFLAAARAAWQSPDEATPLVAWLAIDRARAIAADDPNFWPQARPFVEQALAQPKQLGWRAVGELWAWWAAEQWDEAKPGFEDEIASKLGCLRQLRLVGPFGTGHPLDTTRSFPPEAPGPWPSLWPLDPASGERPRELGSQRNGCTTAADVSIERGIFYAETFIELARTAQAVLAAQGALALWVDDELVLQRDVREWGSWARFGVALQLPKGRHRIVVKLAEPEIALRVLDSAGNALTIDQAGKHAVYGIAPVRRLADPNVLAPFLDSEAELDDVTRLLGALLLHGERLDDVAQVTLEPLVREPALATGPALATSATFVGNDPLFAQSEGNELSRSLQERAVEKDPALWLAQLGLVLHKFEAQGAAAAVADLERLSARFGEVPAFLAAASKAYGELGWVTEQHRIIKLWAERFPDDPEAVQSALAVYEDAGDFARADALAQRLRALEPDSQFELLRALEREDDTRALAELERLRSRRPERTSYAEQRLRLEERLGRRRSTLERLEEQVRATPRDGRAWLELLDARLAAGSPAAVDATLRAVLGADGENEQIVWAQNSLGEITDWDRFRLDGEQIIREYARATRERSDALAGSTAARVLDYSVVWVERDGSSSLLEHQIVRISSEEAVRRFAEQERPRGLVLKARVIKSSGRIIEPELIAEKPTVTFPHLEIGDYVETEHVVRSRGDAHGLVYQGPRWYFREQQIGYARSEFVVITPADRAVFVETSGNPPAVEQHTDAGRVLRRWRVDWSPPAPAEPLSVPASEYLPSVRVAFGPWREYRLEQLRMSAMPTSSLDPRITRIARAIVAGLPAAHSHARAKRVFRWVMDNVRPGEELDGRRSIVARQGNRWQALALLCRALGIDTTFAIAKNRLAAPAPGPLADVEQYSVLLLKVQTDRGAVWTTASEDSAPFGYIPAEARGMPAYELGAAGVEPSRVPDHTSRDLVSLEGSVVLDSEGGAGLQLERRFEGQFAATMRSGLAQVADQRLHEVLESRLLSQDLQGAKLERYRLGGRDAYDAPLVVELAGSMQRFAKRTARELVIEPPFNPDLSELFALPNRMTPLLIKKPLHRLLKLQIELPRGASVALPAAKSIEAAQYAIAVRDRLHDDRLILEREIRFVPGRVSVAEYPRFAQELREMSEALARSIVVRLPP